MAASLASRLWASPTAMMLASTGTQALLAILVLPLVLYRFDAPSVALWALFASIAAVVNVATQSFTVTFVRAIAFASAGAQDLDEIAAGRKGGDSRPPNTELAAALVSGARATYGALAVIALIALAVVGSALVHRMVNATTDPDASWLAWAIVIASTTFTIHGNVYVGYLEGHNQVAMVRRWDAIFALFATASSTTILLLDAGLLYLVASTQLWAAIRVIRNRLLCRQLDGGRYATLPSVPARPAMRALWPAAWRSFLGVALIFGVNYAGGIFYAQVGEPHLVASYLLALRLFDTLSAVARAPFYSRIPALVRLHAQGQTAQQLVAARGGMRFAYWLFIGGLLAAALIGPAVFAAIGSKVPFPPRTLWLLLGLALLLERYGAMHLQLFSTTNTIVWHTAAAGYAVLYLGTILALHGIAGVYAFPLGMLLGYAGWYSWFCAVRSYRAFGLGFWAFERTLFLPPLALGLAATLLAWVWT